MEALAGKEGGKERVDEGAREGKASTFIRGLNVKA